ncbi:UDP-galactopyranose/dTDP-fucopyranose mutase family protein [Frigidibacter sp. MR17.24]|uniref:UDP-galactopyranose/dTDP-fucopyranose mutase family protein n=1 Tax=Frigidibacter sp. MR17.24 TaxID=3127345 RepID=UPI003012D45F
MLRDPILVVGAGLSGAVIARELALAGHPVTVFEARDHVAGNCHTRRDPDTGVMVHVHGPHIFHTDDSAVWDYVTGFARFRPFRNQVKTTVRGQVYSMPINLHTINQFFGLALRPDEARAFVAAQAIRGPGVPESFRDQALALVGPALYEAFLEGYTLKQWGRSPAELPASVLKRLPLRFSYDDNYFFHRHQGMPEAGYTAMVEAILDHPNIAVHLRRPYQRGDEADFAHCFHSGPLDLFFGADLGRLPYRTLDFEHQVVEGDWQGCAVMNYADADVPWTRITQHGHFAPWESRARGIISREYSRAAGEGDTLYYPVRLVAETALLAAYQARAAQLDRMTFVGRLGTYRYLDMDVTIREALDTARGFLASGAAAEPLRAAG